MAEKELELINDKDMAAQEDVIGDRVPRRYQRRRPRQVVPDYVDWKDTDYLRQFVPERGKIMPRRISGISAKDQRRIATAIKRAAREQGMLTMREDAWKKALNGITTIEEVNRRTRVDELMVTAAIHDHAARLHSYRLLAQA